MADASGGGQKQLLVGSDDFEVCFASVYLHAAPTKGLQHVISGALFCWTTIGSVSWWRQFPSFVSDEGLKKYVRLQLFQMFGWSRIVYMSIALGQEAVCLAMVYLTRVA